MRIGVLCLLLTVSAGAQWTLQESHSTASLRGIHALGGGVAWASGSGGTVLRTVDGGKNWQTCAVPEGGEKLDFRGVQGFDSMTAIVMSSGTGDLSRLYKTTDGCKTWKLLFRNLDKEGFWDGIRFADRDKGVLLGDPVNGVFVVMLTFDGGKTWERQKLSATADINGEGVFAASNSSLLLEYGLGVRSFCTGGAAGPRVITLFSGMQDTSGPTTSQQGLGWSTDLQGEKLPITQPSSDGAGCFSMASVSDLGVKIAVGGDYKNPNTSIDTAWTTALPVTGPSLWKAAKKTPHGYRSAVTYDTEAKAWLTVGPNGTDVSVDDGGNWRPLLPGPGDAADSDKHWNALSLPFVVGAHGRIGVLREDAILGRR